MKNLTLLFWAFILPCIAFGQQAGDDYAFKSPAEIIKWDVNSDVPEPPSTIRYEPQRGNIFTISRPKTYIKEGKSISGYLIIFWNFNSKGESVDPNKSNIGQNVPKVPTRILIKDATPGLTFFITEDEFKVTATNDFRKPNGFFKVDAVVIPIKLRFRNKQPGGIFDFGQSISIGPAISKNWNYGGAFGNKSISILGGFNITNVAVDEKNVPEIITSKTTLLGLCPFVGANVEYRGVSFGIMSGIDILTGDAGKKWAYRNSPWLGVSIGTALFSVKTKTQGQ